MCEPFPGVPDSPASPQRIALIACSVFDAEIQLLSAGATHIAVYSRFEIGLHDAPPKLRVTLQSEIDRIDAAGGDFEVIVLAYGLCGLGTEGLCARTRPLVIARAHDCLTHFLGSKELHAQRQSAYPDTYYYTPGWNEARRVPGPERLESLRKDYASRFDAEDIEFLLNTERALWAQRGRGVFVELGTPKATEAADYAKRCTDWLGWSFEHVHGDPALLHDLLWGPRDAGRFHCVRPGESLRFSCDDKIFRSAPL